LNVTFGPFLGQQSEGILVVRIYVFFRI
jgi:hypothetical protein